jgi:hypothetical protein
MMRRIAWMYRISLTALDGPDEIARGYAIR